MPSLELNLALDVADCVVRLHVQCDRFAGQRLTSIVNVDPRSATMVVVSVHDVFFMTHNIRESRKALTSEFPR